MPDSWLIPAALACCLAVASPAFASLASDTFKDVPAGHWAEKGVAEVAIKRDLMRGYPDGTFRGDQPFTRYQFADSLVTLLGDLEAVSQTSWRPGTHPKHGFNDVPPEDRRAAILTLANDYGLFEGLPGVSGDRFEGDRTVTRDEMAQVVDNLMHLAEAKDVVRPPTEGEGPRLSDLAPQSWAYPAIQDVSQRYRVMIGFPDGTFRGPEALTRYQYAQAIAQAVPEIHALIARTVNLKQEERRRAQGPWRFQENEPWRLEALTTPSGLAGLRAGYLGYTSRWAWFADTRLTASTWDGGIGGMWKVPMWGPLQLQPLVEARAFSSGSPALGAALLAYCRPVGSPLGAHLRLGGDYAFNSSFLRNLEVGIDVPLRSKLDLSVSVSDWDVPAGAAVTPNLGITGGVWFGF